jgi:transposase-like protein
MEREAMNDEEFVLGVVVVGVIKGASVSETAKKIGVSEQTLHEMCIQYFDFLDVFQTQLADDGKLSRATETEVKQAVLDAAKYAPAHFKIFD